MRNWISFVLTAAALAAGSAARAQYTTSMGNSPTPSSVPTFMPVNVTPTVMSTKNIYAGPKSFFSWFPKLSILSSPSTGLNTSVFPKQKDMPGMSYLQQFGYRVGTPAQ